MVTHSYYDYFPEKEFIENNIQQYLPIIKDDSDNWKILGIPFYRITIRLFGKHWRIPVSNLVILFYRSSMDSRRIGSTYDIYIDDLHPSLQYNLLGKLGLRTRLETKREELYDEGYYLLSEEEYNNIPTPYRWKLDRKFYYNDEEIEDDNSCCNFPQEESY